MGQRKYWPYRKDYLSSIKRCQLKYNIVQRLPPEEIPASPLDYIMKSRVDFSIKLDEDLYMTKYKEYFERMIVENKSLFDSFHDLHQKYSLDEDKYQEEFNKEGESIMKVFHEWENKLCSQSEKAGFGNYTGNLAEKFQAELKSAFPLIDHVGIVVKKFSLKKLL